MTAPWMLQRNNDMNLAELIPRLKEKLNHVPDYKHPWFLTPNIANEGPYILSGEGARLLTSEGQQILDFSAMTVNCVLGQNDPWVKTCLLAYLDSDLPSFLSSRLKSPIYCTYPERLMRLGIGGIKNPHINHRQCNGSDVTELALKAASLRAGGRRKVASFKGGYHGQNLTSYFVSERQKHLCFLCSDDTCVVFLDTPNHDQGGTSSLSPHEQKILATLAETISDVYAIILEPIQMNNGLLCLSSVFLAELRELCNRHDVCLIYDEVQTGFGWLGSLTATEVSGVTPDILCLSKGITAGYGPMAVMVSTERYSDLPYGCGEKTNGSDIRTLVAANAVLDRLIGIEDKDLLSLIEGNLKGELERGLLGDVNKKSQILKSHLMEFQARHPRAVRTIRSIGLMGGIEFSPGNKKDLLPALVERALAQGLFVRKSGNWLIIKPPITISDGELAEGFDILNVSASNIGY